MALLETALLVGGGIASAFLSKGGGGDTFSKGDLDAVLAQRQRQIDTFRADLRTSRERLSARIGNLQELTFKRFGGQAEAQFGGRGLQVTGGAFQSALARRAADLQAQQDVAISQAERQDILSEQGLRSSLFGQRLGGLTGLGAQASVAGLQQQQALGALTGQLGGLALGGFADFLKQRGQTRSVVRGTSGGAGESGIRAFRNVIG